MNNTDMSTVSNRTITAMFDTREAADRAVADLVEAGIPHQHMNVLASGDKTPDTAEHEGFWESLKNLFMPDDDRHSYAEGLRRGGYMVTVQTEDGNYNRVLDILDRDGAADLDERAATWRNEGWTGASASAASGVGLGNSRRDADLGATPDLRTAGAADPIMPTATSPGMRSMGADATTTSEALRSAGADAGMPLASAPGDSMPATEMPNRVGVRDLDPNRTRVRSYSTSMPSEFNFTSSQIVEHMDVISADGEKIGTVDHLDGPDRIKLAQSTSPDGQHHYVPFTWIDHVDQHVHLKKTLVDIKSGR